jgi:hypothetical protein
MAVTLPRVPGQKHWEVSSSLFQQMEPTEFLTYWDVSYSKLAKICHCSTRTVERWFSRTDYHAPSLFHKFCLASVHRAWTRI